MDKTVSVLLMRHGFSMSNYKASISSIEVTRFDPSLIDCPLHEKGIEESKLKGSKLLE